MQSKAVKYLEEQIEYYNKYLEDSEDNYKELREKLYNVERNRAEVVSKLTDLGLVLELVKEDFKKYGDWNPAG